MIISFKISGKEIILRRYFNDQTPRSNVADEERGFLNLAMSHLQQQQQLQSQYQQQQQLQSQYQQQQQLQSQYQQQQQQLQYQYQQQQRHRRRQDM